jgi:hypothetical protein
VNSSPTKTDFLALRRTWPEPVGPRLTWGPQGRRTWSEENSLGLGWDLDLAAKASGAAAHCIMLPLSRAASATLGAALLLLAAQLWSDESLLAAHRPGGLRQGTGFVGAAANNEGPPLSNGSNPERSVNVTRSSERNISIAADNEEPTQEDARNADEDVNNTPPTTLVPPPDDAVDVSPLLPMRTCRNSSFPIPNKKRWSFTLEYQCEGAEYDNFTAQMHRFANNASLHAPTWGRRPEPLPPGAAVLFMGNSHTKQTALEFACQYSDQIKEVKQRHRSTVAVQFTNGAYLYLVQNSPVEMAVNWTNDLEKLVMRPLRSFQAVVLGQFNGAGSDVRNTSYYRDMKNWSEHGDGSLRFGAVEPPTVREVAEAFPGPLVFASNYDRRKVGPAQSVLRAMDEIRRAANRTNMAGVLARRYIEMLDGNECGTDWRFKVGDCGPTRSGSHRCVGMNGGHPTLIAHDVQEALYSLLDGPASAGV